MDEESAIASVRNVKEEWSLFSSKHPIHRNDKDELTFNIFFEQY